MEGGAEGCGLVWFVWKSGQGQTVGGLPLEFCGLGEGAGLVALGLLHHAVDGLADVQLGAVGGFHLHGLQYGTVHGGYAVAFLFAASQACYHGNNSYDS